MRVRNTNKRSAQRETWYSEAPPRVNKQGEILGVKTWQKLPSDLCKEYCEKKKRPVPIYLTAKSFQENTVRMRVVFPDASGEKNRDLVFCPFESKLKTKHECVAREEAALVV